MSFLDRSEFIDQQIIKNPKPCTFYNSDVNELRSNGILPSSILTRPFDPKSQSDWYSERWVCFPEYPFTIGLKYPFPPIFNEFFSVTGICYAQATPMIWETLLVIQTIIDSHDLDFDVTELSYTFNLHNSGSGFFVFQLKPCRQPLVFNVSQTNPDWESKFFFAFRDSLPNGDLIPSSWVSKANFTKLAPPCQDTKDRILKFLQISEEERTFRYPKTFSLSSMSTSSKPGYQKSLAHFTLEDIDADSPIEKEEMNEEIDKPPSQRRRLIIKKKQPKNTSGQNDPPLEFDKAFDLFYQGMEHAAKCYLEELKVIEGMNNIISTKNAAADKDAAEIIRLKKRIEDLETNNSIESEARFMQQKQKLLAKAEKDAAISVLETRIMMANEASILGFNVPSWRSEIWKDKLAILKGQDLQK